MPEGSNTLDARALLRRFGIRPKKKLGQNFMIDSRALQKVIDAAELSGDETVLEIGAGVGTLTAIGLSLRASRCRGDRRTPGFGAGICARRCS